MALSHSGLTLAMALLEVIAFVACDSPTAADDKDTYCQVEELPDGTISIICPDSSTQIESCYAQLADLNGNGASDKGDCALEGAGALQRALCDSPQAWSTLRACRAETRALLTTRMTQAQPIDIAYDGFTLLASYGDDHSVAFWRDNNQNLSIDPDESYHLPSLAPVEVNAHGPQIAATPDGCATVVDWDVFADSPVNLWVDRDCNKRFDISEHSTPQLAAGSLIDTVLLSNGHVIDIVFLTRPTSRAEAWRDLDADGTIDTGEVLFIGADPVAGIEKWRSRPGSPDQLVTVGLDGVRRHWTIGATWLQESIAMSPSPSHLSGCGLISYIDDGDLLICDNSLVRPGMQIDLPITFQAVTALSAYSMIATPSIPWATIVGRNASAYIDIEGGYYPYKSVIVRDNAVMATGQGFEPVFFVRGDPGGPTATHLTLEYWHDQRDTAFLGESCGFCAGDLVCRVSGQDPTARCVPPLAE